MAFIIGTATFTNGSTSVTNVSLTSGALVNVASGTKLDVGTNPIQATVEAIEAPTDTTMTLRGNWSLPTGAYDFVATFTPEGLRDGIQSLRAATESIGTPNTGAVADTVAKRDSNGRLEAVTGESGNDVVTFGNVTTSASDTTAGRLLKVGAEQSQLSAEAKAAIDGARDGNIGLESPLTPTDLNDIIVSGFSRYSGGTSNTPPWAQDGYVVTSSQNTNQKAYVLIDNVNATMGFSVRSGGGVDFESELYHTGNTGALSFGNGSPAAGVEAFRVGDSVGAAYSCRAGTSSNTHIIFRNENGQVGTISTNGTATSYNTSSDNRLKLDLGKPTDEEVSAKFNDIYQSFTCFNWRTDEAGKKVWGFLAHDVIDKGLDFASEGEGPRELNIGDVYETIPAEYDEDDNETKPEIEKKVSPAGVDQSKVVPYLVAKIEQLERRLATLENSTT